MCGLWQPLWHKVKEDTSFESAKTSQEKKKIYLQLYRVPERGAPGIEPLYVLKFQPTEVVKVFTPHQFGWYVRQGSCHNIDVASPKNSDDRPHGIKMNMWMLFGYLSWYLIVIPGLFSGYEPWLSRCSVSRVFCPWLCWSQWTEAFLLRSWAYSDREIYAPTASFSWRLQDICVWRSKGNVLQTWPCKDTWFECISWRQLSRSIVLAKRDRYITVIKQNILSIRYT